MTLVESSTSLVFAVRGVQVRRPDLDQTQFQNNKKMSPKTRLINARLRAASAERLSYFWKATKDLRDARELEVRLLEELRPAWSSEVQLLLARENAEAVADFKERNQPPAPKTTFGPGVHFVRGGLPSLGRR